MKRLACCLASLGMLLCVSPLALAQPQKAKRYKKDTDAPKVTVIKRGGRTLYKFKPGVIYGKYHRPQAVLMMDRGRDIFHHAAPKKELSSRILETVRRSPF